MTLSGLQYNFAKEQTVIVQTEKLYRSLQKLAEAARTNNQTTHSEVINNQYQLHITGLRQVPLPLLKQQMEKTEMQSFRTCWQYK